MTPGARLQAAIEILGESFAAPLPADAIADAYFRRRRYAGSADRRAIQERMFGILRRKARVRKRRIASQMPVEEKRRRAHYVIDCSGSLDKTRRQVEALYPKLARLAERQR